jgi:hypothetical protein
MTRDILDNELESLHNNMLKMASLTEEFIEKTGCRAGKRGF